MKGRKTPVQKLDKKTGEVLATYASGAEAAESNGIEYVNQLWKAIADNQRSCHGYKWRRVSEV